MELDFSPVFAGWPDILHGAIITVEVTACALVLGCVMGLLVGIGRLDPKRRVIYGICTAYVTFIRGTPLLVQLFIVFFGLPAIGIDLNPYPAAIAALSLNVGGYAAEVVRGSVLSVPRGQTEAAATVGLSGVRAALLIILPQALRVAMPAAGGQYQTLAKASSLAAAIGYPDIMQIVGGTIASQTSQALEAMALVVLLYVAINLFIALIVGVANRRVLAHEGG